MGALGAALKRFYPETEGEESAEFDLTPFRGLPFWIVDKDEHTKAFYANQLKDDPKRSTCCFNHLIGLPEKGNKEHPIHAYELECFDALFKEETTPEGIIKNKHLWVKKATGLGITEWALRILLWLCTKDDRYVGAQACIVTGPNIELAETLIARLKMMLRFFNVPKSKGTVLIINGIRIECFPSHHLDAMRGLPNVFFILDDEGDFFPPQEQQNARDVSERYIAKSDPFILMVSTPNLPGGLFEQIETEDEKTCVYRRLHLPWQVGAGNIYSAQDIQKAKASPSFDREYGLKYGSGLGNCFKAQELDDAQKIDYPLKRNLKCAVSLGIDPAFGSSNFAFVVSQLRNGKIEILEAVQFNRPSFEDMVKEAWTLIEKYLLQENGKIYIDGSNVAFVKAIKQLMGESMEYEDTPKDELEYSAVVPVNFASDGKEMLGFMQNVFSKREIAMKKGAFEELIKDLRSAQEKDGKLDKTKTKHTFDLFDACRLSLKAFKYE